MDFSVYTKPLTNKLRNLAKTYLKNEETLSTTESCCISFKHNECSIITMTHQQGTNEVSGQQKLQFDNFKSLSLVLRGVVEKINLSRTPIKWMLSNDDYQINLIESMPVPANELRTALSWRVRSLINYPMEEALVEYFELPAKSGAQSVPLMGVVTAQKSLLMPVINLLKEIDLHLVKIDIPELSLLKLAALYETDEKSTAFLYFYDKLVILNISNQKVLYFTRRIIIPMTPENTMDYEKLSLEILRYFDFFRSQWRLSSPSRVFSASENGDIELVAKALSERLLNTVQPYTIKSALFNETDKHEIETKYLLDYGCLLEKDSVNVTTGN